MSEFLQLAIVKGIPPVPGDTGSLEQVDDVLDLLNTQGFSVNEKGWIPKLPQVKNGGVYIDNPAVADRFPVVLELGQVQETMTLTVTGSSFEGRYWLESRLFKLAQSARDFWTTENQIQPVYLKWQAPGAKRPQYALIYNIDIAGVKDIFQIANVSQIVITIDREHGWRLIPPGANPKWATYIINGNEAGFNNTTASVYPTGTDHLAYGTCYNRQEFDTVTTFLTKNFIDIPGDKIPGDLPALCCIVTDVNEAITCSIYIAKSTKNTTVSTYPLFNAFPASAASMDNGTTLVTTWPGGGIVHKPISATAYISKCNFATATELRRLFGPVGGGYFTSRAEFILRGSYMVFARVAQNGGASGICKVRCVVFSDDSFLNTIFNSGQVAITNVGNEHLLYMGVVAVNSSISHSFSSDGLGKKLTGNISVEVHAQRTTATGSAELFIDDVIFMPIDEGAVQINPDGESATSMGVDYTYDNTGYYSYAKLETASSVFYRSANFFINHELRGGKITLTPSVNNRLYFLEATTQYGANQPVSSPQKVFNVAINIVPRWSGVVDI